MNVLRVHCAMLIDGMTVHVSLREVQLYVGEVAAAHGNQLRRHDVHAHVMIVVVPVAIPRVLIG